MCLKTLSKSNTNRLKNARVFVYGLMLDCPHEIPHLPPWHIFSVFSTMLSLTIIFYDPSHAVPTAFTLLQSHQLPLCSTSQQEQTTNWTILLDLQRRIILAREQLPHMQLSSINGSQVWNAIARVGQCLGVLLQEQKSLRTIWGWRYSSLSNQKERNTILHL